MKLVFATLMSAGNNTHCINLVLKAQGCCMFLGAAKLLMHRTTFAKHVQNSRPCGGSSQGQYNYAVTYLLCSVPQIGDPCPKPCLCKEFGIYCNSVCLPTVT